MKNTLLLVFLGAGAQLSAQNNFTKVGPPPPAIQTIDELPGLIVPALAFSDVDGDGDEDVLVTGSDGSSTYVAKLYKNDGAGAFELVTGTPFIGMFDGSVTFGDLDGDGDNDLVLTGISTATNDYSAALYLNDGAGNFTLTASPFTGVTHSCTAFADVDDDGDLDVFIGGQSMFGERSELYLNDGSAGFTPDNVANALFVGVTTGAVAFGDIDDDGDLDMFLTGQGPSGFHSELYTNDGNGAFTSVAHSFTPVYGAAAAFEDVDSDGDLDLLVTGEEGNVGATTKLYTNDGNGTFTPAPAGGLVNVNFSTVNFADFDGDGDRDLFITGSYSSNLYLNDGDGLFTIAPSNLQVSGNNSAAGVSDIDSDGDADLLVSGMNITQFFVNDGNAVFSLIANSPFSGLSSGGIAYSDVDGDGDQDVLLTGQALSGFTTKLFINDGNGGYAEDASAPFVQVANSAADFADIDGDGDEDLLISGYATGGQQTKLYTNDGAGIFTLVPGTPFPNVSSGAVAFHDVDADGDQDAMITGFSISGGNPTQLFLNDGTGAFTASGIAFEPVNNGTIDYGDVDGDGDDDLLLTGYGSTSRVANLYTNDGAGLFTLVPGTPFPGVQQGSVGLEDIDGDGDLDVLIAGEAGSPATYTAQLFTNDGTGTFTLVPGAIFDYTIGSSIAFADIDNDLDPDLLVTGYSQSQSSGLIAKLYSNDGTGVFTELVSPFDPSSHGDVEFADVDGDNDLDVIIMGNSTSGTAVNLYRNNNCQQSNVTDTHITCGAYTWIDGVEYTASNNTAFMSYTNAGGCDSIVTLNLTIGDVAAIPSNAVLADHTAECEVTGLTAPTATFNCSGTVTGTTTTTFPISTPGTTVVTWTYTAPGGLTATQTQNVVIADVTYPEPDLAMLPAYTSTCPVTEMTIPTATDNCSGTIQATTSDLPVTTPGSNYIVWYFEDAAGNIAMMMQQVIYTPMNDTITLNGITLTVAQSSVTYQWLDCDAETIIEGATSQAFTPTANGNYAVAISNGDCSVYSDCFAITTLSAEELSASLFSVYPNPNAGSFTIETAQALTVRITNAAGQLITEQQLQAGKSDIQLENIESGIYFVSSSDASGTRSVHTLSVVK